MKDILKKSYCLLIVVSLVFPAVAVAEEEILIALRAHQGAQKALEKWQATADYLTDKIPGYRFVLVPFENNSALNQAVSLSEYHFCLTNPASAVEHRIRYGAQPLATLVNKRQRRGYSKFGSVIFTRADRKDINELNDLKGKTFIAVDEIGFGGWRVAWREFLTNDINPYADFKELSFAGGKQQTVVYAVRDGRIDAGSVRTDMLERLDASGIINLADFKVLNNKKTEGFPFLHSTELYPEWLFSAVRKMDDNLKTKVVGALFSIPSDGVAAKNGKYVGWISPLDYTPVENLLKELRVGPYHLSTMSSFERLVSQYGLFLIIVFIVIVLLMFIIIYMVRLNRYAATTRNEMLAAKHAAESANQSKSEFLAMMSHEIRTPLSGALSMSKLLEKTPLNTKQHEYVDAIIYSGESLLMIINDVLDISKIEAGQLQLEETEFNLKSIVEKTIRLLAVNAKQRSNNLNYSIDDSIPPVLVGDPTRLRQILFNLINNAIKFTKGGEIKVEVINKSESTNSDNVDLSFSVVDNGIGIPEAVQPRLFDTFTQADSSTSRIYGGSGLGLAICSRLIEIMRGKIGVDSKEGIGSTFWFELRLSLGKSTPLVGDDDGATTNEELSRALDILLVEDDYINQLAVTRLLEQEGHQVTIASDGYTALDILSHYQGDDQFPFNLILVDIHMPGLSGLETTARIRKMPPPIGTLPVVALTADVTVENIKNCYAAGIDKVLSKPIRLDEFTQVIGEISTSNR